VVIELFLVFIFYNYYKIEEEHLSEQLFLEMKNYSFSFDDKHFDMDIVPKDAESKLYELYFDEENLYILTPFLEENSSLVILYPIESYHEELNEIKKTLLIQFLLLSLISGVLSVVFSIYSLSPIKESMRLLEEFIKDIIHDLNTPITSILINLKMMEKNEETQSIEQSTKAISMLHKNLDVYLRNTQLIHENVQLKEVVMEQVEFFQPLYDHLSWEVMVENSMAVSNRHGLNRILYNLVSNACKYNISNGFIKISSHNNTIIISNSSHGIKKPKKVFERFYKESERGLGIGLHIVDKLCRELEIEKSLTVEENVVTVKLFFK
jgi:two-component system OmpR family sensor kinase